MDKRAMILICIASTFIISNIAIVAGYYNTLLGVDWTAIEWVYKSIPVFKGSIFLSMLWPLNLIFAFFTSKGTYDTYKNELIILTLTLPYFVIFLTLPGEAEIPSHLQFNMTAMIAIMFIPQILFTYLLAPRFWAIGGRTIGK